MTAIRDGWYSHVLEPVYVYKIYYNGFEFFPRAWLGESSEYLSRESAELAIKKIAATNNTSELCFVVEPVRLA